MTTPDINIDRVPRDSRIDRALTAALVGYVASIDGRVLATDATVSIWEKAFTGAPFGLIRDTIDAWFLTYRNADYKPVPDPAAIRRQAQRQMEVQGLKQRALAPPRGRKGGPPPRRFIEEMQTLGILTDRDPNDYPEKT